MPDVTTIAATVIGLAALVNTYPSNAASVKDSNPDNAQYVGAASCTVCHTREAADWRQSHHAQAMQMATVQTALGDFNGVTLRNSFSQSRFFKRNDKFFVRTDGPDGKTNDFEVRYTFGVFPLQQYLVELPGGRLQPLDTAWDARPKEQGGQRWFSLYPRQNLKAGDALHWSGRDKNWNFMCASCHSTNLQRNYDLASDSYKTTWSDINVACEACHGPGASHVAWVNEGKKAEVANSGFALELNAGKKLSWGFSSPAQNIATPQPPVDVRGDNRHNEAEACFPCHSRRQELKTGDGQDQAFLDRYQPSLLERNQYHADGQIDGEVFEFGAFAQSKMYRAGVTCSDCHLPHSVKLREVGNALCAKCHKAGYYDRPEHHHHQSTGVGADCIQCHMPNKTYMGVHRRHDHGFRVPQSEVSKRYQTPIACAQCHASKSPRWVSDALRRWGLRGNDLSLQMAEGIDAAWKGSARTENLLVALASEPRLTSIQRATILSLVPPTRSPAVLGQIVSGLSSESPIVRLGAVRGLANLEPQLRIQIGLGLLVDPLRAIRVEAARALANVPRLSLSAEQQTHLDVAVAEAIDAELTAAERPESHVNLGQLYLRLKRQDDAERELKTALQLSPRFIPAFVNLADLLRLRKQDGEGEKLLRKAIALDPQAASPRFALGLLKIRQGHRSEAMDLLKRAASLEPLDSQYAYVYAVALHDAGDSRKALSVIDAIRKHAPEDGSLLQLQIGIEEKLGLDQAAAHRTELERLAVADKR